MVVSQEQLEGRLLDMISPEAAVGGPIALIEEGDRSLLIFQIIRLM